MKISKQSAVKCFYYLMAVDDNISDLELSKLNDIGKEMDPDAFDSYKEQIIEECTNAVNVADKDELFDIICESVNKEIVNYSDNADDDCIPSRLLVWNLMVIAAIDSVVDINETRLIHHVGRLCNIEKSVIQEMENTIKTISNIDEQLALYQQSGMPYSEVRPLVDQLENRKSVLLGSIKELVSDEMVIDVETVTVKDDLFDKAGSFIKEKTAPVTQKVAEGAEKTWEAVKEKSAPAVKGTKKFFGNAWKEMKDYFKPTPTQSQNENEKENK